MTPDSFVQAVPLPSVHIGPDRRIGALNTSAQTALGAGGAGRHYTTVFRQPELVDQIETCLDQHVRASCRIRLPGSGRDTYFEAHTSPIAGAGGALVVLSDQTLVRAAGRMRSDFVANVSHELRTPLTALSGFIETLQGPARDDAAARERFLGIMADETERMTRLVADLLALSNIEHQAAPPRDEQVDICALIQEAIKALPQAALVALSGCEGAPVIPGERDMLRIVVSNLLDNAVKYGGDGPVEVAVRSHETLPDLPGPSVSIAVTDHGEGIAAHHLARLTERFYRIDSHRSRGMGGTGLGLAIVKSVVTRHRGRLKIDSVPGQGSVFTAIFPRV